MPDEFCVINDSFRNCVKSKMQTDMDHNMLTLSSTTSAELSAEYTRLARTIGDIGEHFRQLIHIKL